MGGNWSGDAWSTEAFLRNVGDNNTVLFVNAPGSDTFAGVANPVVVVARTYGLRISYRWRSGRWDAISLSATTRPQGLVFGVSAGPAGPGEAGARMRDAVSPRRDSPARRLLSRPQLHPNPGLPTQHGGRDAHNLKVIAAAPATDLVTDVCHHCGDVSRYRKDARKSLAAVDVEWPKTDFPVLKSSGGTRREKAIRT